MEHSWQHRQYSTTALLKTSKIERTGLQLSIPIKNSESQKLRPSELGAKKLARAPIIPTCQIILMISSNFVNHTFQICKAPYHILGLNWVQKEHRINIVENFFLKRYDYLLTRSRIKPLTSTLVFERKFSYRPDQ